MTLTEDKNFFMSSSDQVDESAGDGWLACYVLRMMLQEFVRLHAHVLSPGAFLADCVRIFEAYNTRMRMSNAP